MQPVTAASLKELLTAGRMVEARTLLTIHESSLSAEEQQELIAAMDRLQAQAEELIAEAERLERTGKIREAKACCESILLIASDYPGLGSRLQRLQESLLLTAAVQHRRRRMRQATVGNQSPGPSRALLRLGFGLATGLLLVLVAVAVLKQRPARVPMPQAPPLVAATQPTAPPPADKPLPVPQPPLPQPAATQEPALAETVAAAPPAVLPAEPLPLPAAAPAPAPATAAVAVAPSAEPDLPPQPQPVAPVPPPQSLPSRPGMHRVQTGESLSRIAERLLCNEGAWKQIYQLNRDRIANPNRLQPGMELELNGIESRCRSGSEATEAHLQ